MTKDNRGMTLVEVVVVSVILLVLATMLIPKYVGYLTENSEEKRIKDAEQILEATQIKLYGLYAESSHSDDDKCIIPGSEDTKSNVKVNPTTYKISDKIDCDIHWNPMGAEILKEVGFNIKYDEPCIVIVGTGRYDIYADPNNPDGEYDPAKAYTVYFVIYVPYFKDKNGNFLKNGFVLYSDGTVTNKLPVRDANKKVKLDNKAKDELYLQFYYIKNGMGNDNWAKQTWDYAKKLMKA